VEELVVVCTWEVPLGPDAGTVAGPDGPLAWVWIVVAGGDPDDLLLLECITDEVAASGLTGSLRFRLFCPPRKSASVPIAPRAIRAKHSGWMRILFKVAARCHQKPVYFLNLFGSVTKLKSSSSEIYTT
jgi:hypothetical protein